MFEVLCIWRQSERMFCLFDERLRVQRGQDRVIDLVDRIEARDCLHLRGNDFVKSSTRVCFLAMRVAKLSNHIERRRTLLL